MDFGRFLWRERGYAKNAYPNNKKKGDNAL